MNLGELLENIENLKETKLLIIDLQNQIIEHQKTEPPKEETNWMVRSKYNKKLEELNEELLREERYKDKLENLPLAQVNCS